MSGVGPPGLEPLASLAKFARTCESEASVPSSGASRRDPLDGAIIGVKKNWDEY